MAIYAASGTYNAIVGVVNPSAKLVAVVGNVYVAGSGPGGTVTNVSFAPPASNAFAVATPTTTPNISFQNVGVTPTTSFLRGDGQWAAPADLGGTVTSVTVGPTLTTALLFATSTTTPILNSQNVGAAPTAVFLRGDGTWASPPSGGGGTFTETSMWTGGTANKNAFISPGNINNVGITINLTASSGSGQITAATISLNGQALPNLYVSTGAFPNLTITIPVADITGNAAQTASSVMVSLVGTYSGSNVGIANAGTLTNTQPTPFTTTLTGSYNIASAPYYTTTATLNYSYTNANAITIFGGALTPGGNCTSPSGSFQNTIITGSNISGSASGNGLNGAGIGQVFLSGTVPAVPTYTPAFWVQTANATVPTFTTASTQTPGSQINATITYPVATATTQYNWVATTQALNKVMVVTPFGNSALVPDVTSSAVIAGVTFNIFGATSLTIGSAARFLIIA